MSQSPARPVIRLQGVKLDTTRESTSLDHHVWLRGPIILHVDP